MSTKSTIINIHMFEMFEETSEPQDVFGKFQGCNIYFILEPPAFERLTLEGAYLILDIDLIEHLPYKMKFWGGDIVKMEYDNDGLLIVFKGGTKSASHLERKDYSIFSI
jgi:hypothetical protein